MRRWLTYLRFAASSLAILIGAGSANAQTPAEAAAINMQLAVQVCLSNYAIASEFVPAFQNAGFTVVSGMEAGVFEFSAYGVNGFLSPQDFANGCSVQSEQVPLATATEMAQSLITQLFGSNAQSGHPENIPTPCPIWSIFANRRLIVVEVVSAGNGGVCTDPTSSGIIVR